MNTLTLVPTGNLGQRMRAVASGVELAAQGVCNLRIAWPHLGDKSARFSDLFLPFNIPEILSFLNSENAHSIGEFGRAQTRENRAAGNVELLEAGIRDLPSGRKDLWLPTLLRTGRFRFQTSHFRPQDTARLIHALLSGDAYAASHHLLGKYPPTLIGKLFCPTQEILARISSITSAFGPRTAGVRISRTRSRSSITNSPLSLFIKTIDEMGKNGEADHIFLSTDSKQVEAYLKQRYRDFVITRPESTQKSRVRHMQDAVTDIWCLSHTYKILGSYHSYHSEVAAELGGTPLQIVRNKTA